MRWSATGWGAARAQPRLNHDRDGRELRGAPRDRRRRRDAHRRCARLGHHLRRGDSGVPSGLPGEGPQRRERWRHDPQQRVVDGCRGARGAERRGARAARGGLPRGGADHLGPAAGSGAAQRDDRHARWTTAVGPAPARGRAACRRRAAHGRLHPDRPGPRVPAERRRRGRPLWRCLPGPRPGATGAPGGGHHASADARGRLDPRPGALRAALPGRRGVPLDRRASAARLDTRGLRAACRAAVRGSSRTPPPHCRS